MQDIKASAVIERAEAILAKSPARAKTPAASKISSYSKS
jgi:hypothetical protein